VAQWKLEEVRRTIAPSCRHAIGATTDGRAAAAAKNAAGKIRRADVDVRGRARSRRNWQQPEDGFRFGAIAAARLHDRCYHWRQVAASRGRASLRSPRYRL